MSTLNRNNRITFGATTLAIAIGAALAFGQLPASLSPIASAYAQDSHGSSHQSTGHTDSNHGSGQKQKGKSGTSGKGSHGSGGSSNVESKVLRGHDTSASASEEENSDRRGPKYSGGKASTGKPTGAGTKKGDLFGDAIVILRDDNGVPILDQYGHVQPLDANGNLIPINEEGEIEAGSEDLVVPVEIGRLNVSRSPTKVSSHSYDEALSTLNAATAISVDDSGRLVVTIDGVEKTIDSPLENLALYEALMTNGYLPGFVPKDGVDLGSLSFLTDKSVTNADLLQAASFLAAASDKTGSISEDTVVYVDSFLKIVGTDPVTGADGQDYFNFSTVSYDRASTYTGNVTYLENNGDGTYTTVTKPIMDVVFNNEDYSGTQLDAFTQAADDARAVIEFVHDHAVPE
jgi:hypothetical protein